MPNLISFSQKEMVQMRKQVKEKKYLLMLTKGEHRHGLMLPLSKQQVTSWIYFVFN